MVIYIPKYRIIVDSNKMGGGLMELTATGAEDLYLIGNPQITFFKSVYRKYTNFAIEYISQELSGPLTLSQTTITSYKCKINRNADLLSNMYLTLCWLFILIRV